MMLHVDNVTIGYGNLDAVRDVTIEVAKGEAVGIVGSNGAGKTTILNAISGQLKPRQGKITFLDEDITGSSSESIARRGVSLVPEGRRIFASMTVEENLSLASNARTEAGDYDSDRVKVLDLLPELKPLLSNHAGHLSGGEQQQLAIARALLSQPQLLMLDEPSLGLAPRIVDTVFEVLEQLRSDGVTILLVEQNARRALRLIDRAYVLRTGSVTDSGTGSDLLESADVVSQYLGEEA